MRTRRFHGKYPQGRRLRICIVAVHFAEYALRFANALAEHADVLLILNRVNYKSEIEGLEFDIRTTLRISKYRLYTKHGIWPSLPTALREIWRFDPDVLHIEEVSNPSPAILNLVFRRRSLMVLRVHDPEFHEGDRDIPKWRLLFFGWMRRSADLVLVHGDYCKSEFLKRFENSVEATVHGVLLLPSADLLLRPEPKRVLMFGRMTPYKGLDTLLAATKILNQSGVQFTLHLAGRGTQLTALRAEFEKLGNVLIDDEYLAPRDVVIAFQKASVVVLPYKEATQSGVLAAAIGNRRPVIATRVGGISEIIAHGENGVLVSPDSADELASGIRRLLEDNQFLDALKIGIRITAEDQLNWSNIAIDTLRLYRQSLT